jgi:predicted ATPase
MRSPLDLIWFRRPGTIDLAFDFAIPPELPSVGNAGFISFRYSLTLGISSENSFPVVTQEDGLLISGTLKSEPLFNRGPDGRVQAGRRESSWLEQIRRKPTESVLEILFLNTESQLLDWLQEFLYSKTERIDLRNDLLSGPSKPTPDENKLMNGENLPRLIRTLQTRRPELYLNWLAHMRIFFPSLQDIEVIQRPEDHALYVMLHQDNGLRVPSWSVSAGTLRAMALTIIPYLDARPHLYLVEEPENGIHPTVMEAVYQSLSSVYDGQVLVTSHSPILLSIVQPAEVLCFSRSAESGSRVIRGDEHPALRDWHHEVSLGTLFASGILDGVA